MDDTLRGTATRIAEIREISRLIMKYLGHVNYFFHYDEYRERLVCIDILMCESLGSFMC